MIVWTNTLHAYPLKVNKLVNRTISFVNTCNICHLVPLILSFLVTKVHIFDFDCKSESF